MSESTFRIKYKQRNGSTKNATKAFKRVLKAQARAKRKAKKLKAKKNK